MAGLDRGGPEWKGISRYFNTTTDFGRRNFAVGTYAFIGAISLYFYLKPKKTAEPAKAK